MKITTSQQQAAVACCPCEVPECPPPRKECQSLYCTGGIGGFMKNNPQPGDPHYKKRIRKYAGAGQLTFTYSYTEILYADVGGKVVAEQSDQTETQTGGAPFTYDPAPTTTFEDAVTLESGKASLLAIIEANYDFEDEDQTKGSLCASSVFGLFELTTTSVEVTYARYRFAVPEGFSTPESPRSTYLLQWDEVSAPQEWWEWFEWDQTEPEPSPGPTLIASREWTWAGNMEEPWSEYFNIPLPSDAGHEVRTVNGLVRCFNSTRCGVKPTSFGDQVAL